MLGPSVFWMDGGFLLEFDMCGGEKLRVKTFFQYQDPFGKKVLIIQSCVASSKEENE
jgi:hypothetical protein